MFSPPCQAGAPSAVHALGAQEPERPTANQQKTLGGQGAWKPGPLGDQGPGRPGPLPPRPLGAQASGRPSLGTQTRGRRSAWALRGLRPQGPGRPRAWGPWDGCQAPRGARKARMRLRIRPSHPRVLVGSAAPQKSSLCATPTPAATLTATTASLRAWPRGQTFRARFAAGRSRESPDRATPFELTKSIDVYTRQRRRNS